MANTVFANRSTHQGQSVAAFPDVCKTPFPKGPVPIPYPNAAGSGQQNTAVSKTKPIGPVTAGATYSASRGDEAGTAGRGVIANKQMRAVQLRTQIFRVHSEMAALPPGNPTRWHRLLDDYVILTAELYKTLTD